MSRFGIASTVLVLGLGLAHTNATTPSPHSRAQALLAQMTTEEKIVMVHGSGWNNSYGNYVGQVPGNSRLSIPSLNLNDGPQGFRDNWFKGITGTSTQWPSGLSVAATWDRKAIQSWGEAMGEEFYAKGANVQLGPGVCLARIDRNGRNFEYMSGEDPFLGYELVQPAITGIQSKGVIANVKHFILNNQETNRDTVSANIDERTLMEMYMRPFAGAIKANVGSAMCSYNKINQVYSCESNSTLQVALKNYLNFSGWVMSDWRATHSTVDAALAGLDQEMPGDTYFGAALMTAVQNGSVPVDVLDDKVLRILTAMFTAGIFDRPAPTGSLFANVTSQAHNDLARNLANSAAVLLKNDDSILPLSTDPSHTIAIIGSEAMTPTTGGGGSGAVIPYYTVSPYDGILEAIYGSSPPSNPPNIIYKSGDDVSAAVEAAKLADFAIVFGATSSHEGHDRYNLSLNGNEDALISAVVDAQAHTVVAVVTPGALLMPWADKAAAVVAWFMPGQEYGHSVGDILFGSVSPSGHLPLTMPNKMNEQEMTQSQYPGLPLSNPLQANYTEKLLVGYRWYQAHNVTPKFPFGHGLSYSTASYSDIAVDGLVVRVTVTNTGSVAAQFVPQLYVGYPTSAGEPEKQLKGFEKVSLTPGDSTTVSFDLSTDDKLTIWNVNTKTYQPFKGKYDVWVGSSSSDLPLHTNVIV